MYYATLLLSFIALLVRSQVIYKGPCNVTSEQVMEKFDLNKFVGTWHVIEKIPNYYQRGECLDSMYIIMMEGIAINFETEKLGEFMHYMSSTIEVTDGYIQRMVVSFGTEIFFHYVVATNYADYALIYGCKDHFEDDTRSVFGWKLSRTSKLSTKSNWRITSAMERVPDLLQASWLTTNHSHCIDLS